MPASRNSPTNSEQPICETTCLKTLIVKESPLNSLITRRRSRVTTSQVRQLNLWEQRKRISNKPKTSQANTPHTSEANKTHFLLWMEAARLTSEAPKSTKMEMPRRSKVFRILKKSIMK